jgi:peptidoglycan/xylan/chitin deacetylase (PgdA/CDA1 family)
MAQVVDWVQHGTSLPPRPVLVTFDDGFDDNYRYAFPILRDRGVPATVFVATDLTGREGSVWYEQVAYALVNGPVTLPLPPKLALQVADGTHPGWRGGEPGARRLLLAAVLDELKNATLEDNRAYVAVVNAAYPVRPEHAALSRMLDWQQVAEMAGGGIDFGSHGASHALLSRLPEGELVDELVRSRAALESATGHPVVSIAYPVGSRRAFDERVLGAVSDCGYVAGFSYLPGIAGASAATPLALPRLHVERYTTRAMFAAMLSLPEVFH